MRSCFITFRSVTFAQRGDHLLHRAGISCTLQRTPRWMEEQGCGYSLLIRSADLSGAVELLREKQVPFRKVYQKNDNGSVEEMVL